MKKIACVSLLLCSAMLSVSSFAKTNEQSIDEIVAVVNDDIITKSEFSHAIYTTKSQMEHEQISIPTTDVLHKQVLDQLINKRLQLQVAEKAGVQISDAELDSTIQRIADQNNMPVSMLYQSINQEGLSTEDYRRELRDQMTMQKLQQQEVAGKISISPQEINGFMKSHTWQSNSAKEYHLEDILIPLSDTPSPAEIQNAKSRAESVIAKLKQGKNFHDVAQAESGSSNALEGGDLGWRSLAEIPSAFTDEVTKMEAKQISSPIQTSNGIHVLHLLAARNLDGKSSKPDRKQIENMLLQQKFEEAIQNWVSKLRSQAFIEIPGAKAKEQA